MNLPPLKIFCQSICLLRSLGNSCWVLQGTGSDTDRRCRKPEFGCSPPPRAGQVWSSFIKSHLNPPNQKKPERKQSFCWNCFIHRVICLEIPPKLRNPTAKHRKGHQTVTTLKDGGTWGSVWRWAPWDIHLEVTVSPTAAGNTASPVMVHVNWVDDSQKKLDHTFLISTELNRVSADEAVCCLGLQILKSLLLFAW